MGIRVAPLRAGTAKNSLLAQREHHRQVRDRQSLNGLDSGAVAIAGFTTPLYYWFRSCR